MPRVPQFDSAKAFVAFILITSHRALVPLAHIYGKYQFGESIVTLFMVESLKACWAFATFVKNLSSSKYFITLLL
ncbi:MAG TPA: hypothetical protein DCG33_09105 [Prevotellaceae bacterium]|nr:hypothetical protein [Prevotellaceae bacterium]